MDDATRRTINSISDANTLSLEDFRQMFSKLSAESLRADLVRIHQAMREDLNPHQDQIYEDLKTYGLVSEENLAVLDLLAYTSRSTWGDIIQALSELGDLEVIYQHEFQAD